KRPTQFELTEFNGGKIMGIWRYDHDAENRIYFQISEDAGQTWTDPAPVPYLLGMNYNTLDKFELLTDLQETVHLFAVGYDEDTRVGPGVYHVEYRQGRWLRPQQI